MASFTYLSQTWVLKHFLCSRKGHGSVTFPSRLWCPGNFLRHKNTCGFASSCLLWANILCFLFFKADACIFTDFKPLSPCCTAKLPQKAACQRIRVCLFWVLELALPPHVFEVRASADRWVTWFLLSVRMFMLVFPVCHVLNYEYAETNKREKQRSAR